MRALSFVATAATPSGPLGSWGSGTASPRCSASRFVSPQLWGLVFASVCTVRPCGGVFTLSTLRVSGKSVLTPPMSRVIACGSYCCTIGTSGPMPKSRPIGFGSTIRLSPSSKPYFAAHFFIPSFWNGLSMTRSLPLRPA